jgi:hypothetical protein
MNALCRATLLAGCLLYPMAGPLANLIGADEGPPLLHQEIDELIEARLTDLKIAPAEISSDAEFLRRASLDLTGLIPTAKRVREFLSDTAPDKRQRLIDELLASPESAMHMARVFDVMLMERRIPTISSYDVPAPQWRTFLATAFAENRPWDQLVREILRSDGTDPGNAAGVKFYLVRDVAPHQLTRDIGRLFLGVDLQCAQCHDDPRIETYRQADYYGIYAFVQRLNAFRDNEDKVSLVGETAVGKATFVSVFTAENGETSPRLPGGEMVPDPELEKGQEYVVKPGPKDRGVPTYSRRLKLAELLPRAETQGFSRNIVNRLWAMLMGRGLVHPLDLHHAGNPPSHPELLQRLELWFVAHNFDIKALLRELTLSRTYQRSSVLPVGVTQIPEDSFAVASLRGLTPEQLSWSILRATGRVEQHIDLIEAKRNASMVESADTQSAWESYAEQLEPLERQSRTLVSVFAGLPGQPDGDFQPIVDQALHLLNSPTMLPLIRDEPSTLLTRLTAISETDLLAEELYLSVLSRHPNTEEIAQVNGLIDSRKPPEERREPLTALIWGLLLSSEFRLNH